MARPPANKYVIRQNEHGVPRSFWINGTQVPQCKNVNVHCEAGEIMTVTVEFYLRPHDELIRETDESR